MGYRLREAREKKNMTQEELAEASGVSRVTISTLECNPSYITTTKTLLKLASALGTTIDDIFFVDTV